MVVAMFNPVSALKTVVFPEFDKPAIATFIIPPLHVISCCRERSLATKIFIIIETSQQKRISGAGGGSYPIPTITEGLPLLFLHSVFSFLTNCSRTCYAL